MASSEPSPEMIRLEEPIEVEKHSKSDDVIANSENDEVVLEELTLTSSDNDVNHSASEKASSKPAHALDQRTLLETLPIVASTGRSCAGVKVDFGVPVIGSQDELSLEFWRWSILERTGSNACFRASRNV